MMQTEHEQFTINNLVIHISRLDPSQGSLRQPDVDHDNDLFWTNYLIQVYSIISYCI